MEEVAKKLFKFKEIVDQKSKEKERITGKIETVEKSFKDYGCADVDQAIDMENTLQDSMASIKTKLIKGVSDLGKQYADLVKE